MKTNLCLIVLSGYLLVSFRVNGQGTCAPTTAQADIDINNVRTTILVGGDMWWDKNTAKYEIPKGSGKHSLFAGALWIGGVDAGGQIKVAAQTYRQTGDDFWGGALDTTSSNITNERCLAYDKIWKITRQEVQDFIADPSAASNNIKLWPGNGKEAFNESHYLAPFVDVDNDGVYNHNNGDYPNYNFSGDYPKVDGLEKTVCNDYLFGDQTLWWVFNDKGNIHGETGSEPIGLEIRAQAFAFQSNDEINNMTFYKYQIINRSTLTLTDTYFGQWVDPDLGYSDDDYVGCDVRRGLGFCYNGDAEDDGASGYGINPPAVGVDFFQGPAADVGDTIDNDRDGCIDCTFITDSLGNTLTVPDYQLREQIIMSKFVYYENTNNHPQGNPNGYTDFYKYLSGFWLDNQPMTFGGDGTNPSNPPTNFMFPGNTDPAFPNMEWSEQSVQNPVGDRRFLQSAGTFTLLPGAVNYVTTGIVWARATQGGPLASIDLVKLADDKAQALFDNCFKLIDGPDAPEVAIRELNRKIILTLLNTDTSSIESYHVKDPVIPVENDSLKYYDFQGYQVFQLKNSNVTVGDIGNPDLVRLVAQSDIKDGIAQLVNFTYEPSLNANIPVEMVNGSDKGIQHTIEITKDLFATGNANLVNHKTYYYTVVSYAYNNYKNYDPADPNALDGQKKPYLAGRNNVKTYSAIPHSPAPEQNGMSLNSTFGQGIYLTRIEGQGNGGRILDFTPATVEKLLHPPFIAYHSEYLPNRGPVDLKVFDPVAVKSGNFEIRMNEISDETFYLMSRTDVQKTIPSEYAISRPNEQIYPEWGFSSMITTTIDPGDTLDLTNGFLEGTISFSNQNQQWLSAVKDVDGAALTGEDWIRSGITSNDYKYLDDREVYEKVAGGTWAPYKLASKDPVGPKWSSVAEGQISLSPSGNVKTGINSIDIVFTSDKSKWSRAAVVESGFNYPLNIGSARQFDLRNSPSIGKNGEPDASVSAVGMGWFPGYAYNLETGERLNIAFGENSSLQNENSTDMKFNPTSRVTDATGKIVLGGMHFIYIFGHNGDGPYDVPVYDSCRYISTMLQTGNMNDKRAVWKDAMWCNIPLVNEAYRHLDLPDAIPSDVTVRLRVSKKFNTYAGARVIKNTGTLEPGKKYFVSSTPVTHNGITYTNIADSFVAVNTTFTGNGSVSEKVPENNYVPLYRFGTSGLAPVTSSDEIAKDALSMVNVVPNPYYAYSGYETSQLDTRIKLTNLPPVCTITILTTSGTIVKQIRRDVFTDNTTGTEVSPKTVNFSTSADWDLKNQVGIPIASGMYLIHIDAGHLGQKTLKWFAMLRPIDLDTF